MIDLFYRLFNKLGWTNLASHFFLKLQLANLATHFRISSNAEVYEISNDKLKIELRKKGSDILVAQQIFVVEEYKVATDWLLKHMPNASRMIDLGGNIGLSSIYLHQFFPKMEVAILEPDQGNYDMLRQNFMKNGMPVQHCFQKAIWSQSKPLAFDRSYGDGKDWAVSVREKDFDNLSVVGISMGDLLDVLGWSEIDFLKIDIEGAEAELFNEEKSDLSFLKITHCLAIEVHHDVASASAIEDILKRYGFDITHTGELTLAYKLC